MSESYKYYDELYNSLEKKKLNFRVTEVNRKNMERENSIN